jgi:hypothetical protein
MDWATNFPLQLLHFLLQHTFFHMFYSSHLVSCFTCTLRMTTIWWTALMISALGTTIRPKEAASECNSSKNGGSPKHRYPQCPCDLSLWPECCRLCYECSVFNQCIKMTCWYKRGERMLKVCTAVIININNLPHTYNLLRLWCNYL